jgi:hypothetical protein
VNPFVFIVGCPRSGTTLLRRIANAHPELAILREQHWLPRYWHFRIGIDSEGIVTGDLLDMLLSDRRFMSLTLPFKRVAQLVEDGAPKHYSHFVSDLFDLHGEAKGKRLVGEKSPTYVRDLPTLDELWPHAKIVHLIRDGRDVALSLLDWDIAERNVGRSPTWDEDPLTTAGLYWEWNVRLGREDGVRLGPQRYYELRYEALVTDPELECRQLCGFLGLGYHPAMLRFHEGRTRPARSAKQAYLPVTAGLRKWRQHMVPNDVARFEAAAGKLLDELGYGRVAVAASDEALAHAERLRDAFVDHIRSKRVPQAWDRVVA